MLKKLHSIELFLKLFFYFILGLILACTLWLSIFKTDSIVKDINRTLPANIPKETNYAWSPDGHRIAFQSFGDKQNFSEIIILNIKQNTTTTATTIPDAKEWFGQVKLAWISNEILAYSRVVTDDSLPNWEVISGPSTDQKIWENRDIVSVSPDYKNVLTLVTPKGTVGPSQALEYEIIITATKTQLNTHINAYQQHCAWTKLNKLNCTKILTNKVQ